MIERNIDYLVTSLSLSESTVIMKGFRPISPVRFYKRGYVHPMGFRLYFGNPNSKLAMVVASGETMQSLRNDQYLDAEILDWMLSQGGKISRMDLAVTEYLEDDFVTVEDVRTWYEQGLVDSSLVGIAATEISTVSVGGGSQVETLYIGRMSERGRKGIFRAYDKGIEMGIGSEIVTRIELELKRDKAHNVAKRLAQSNDIAGNFRTHFNVRSQDFERLMDADAVPAIRGVNQVKQAEEDEIAKRWDWLLNQVAPALKQAISDERKRGNGDTRLIQFMQASGILSDARVIADYLSEAKYRDMLRRNELVERGKE